ncbi:MAG: selenide, water dikinase SelD, partial [Chitinophagaceae bacterium]|nr:selenide, water dikinase SelD [Chitinophagaceae bacterium]
YSSKVKFEKGVNVMEAFTVLPDPQTNGGLLISVSEAALQEVQALFSANGLAVCCEPIGKMIAAGEHALTVL